MQAVIFDLDETVFAPNNTLHDDVVSLLDILRRLGIKIGALTSGDHRMLVRLDEAGIRNHFDGVVCTAHVPTPKDPEGIQHLLRTLNTEATYAAIVSHIGDDLRYGKHAGLAKTIHVVHGPVSTAPKHVDADHVVKDIPAVLDVLE
jgi:phosphoglycolate phosphatase-like HAD superfamily hydrolase